MPVKKSLSPQSEVRVMMGASMIFRCVRSFLGRLSLKNFAKIHLFFKLPTFICIFVYWFSPLGVCLNII